MQLKKYMILLVDRQKAKMFSIVDGTVLDEQVIFDDQVPQNVKHGDDSWDAQNKIFRHIEDHLHRHLKFISEKAAIFAKQNNITHIIIGSHKPLFAKIEKHLPYPVQQYVKGRFVTELKGPFKEVIKRAHVVIAKIEAREKENEGRRASEKYSHTR